MAQVECKGDRYNAWVAIMPPALVAQNFTENGWGLSRAPKDLTDDLFVLQQLRASCSCLSSNSFLYPFLSSCSNSSSFLGSLLLDELELIPLLLLFLLTYLSQIGDSRHAHGQGDDFTAKVVICSLLAINHGSSDTCRMRPST